MAFVRFAPNRVRRVYKGGATLDHWRGAYTPADGYRPEEWIASTVPAINAGTPVPDEGYSLAVLPDGGTERFDQLLARNPLDWLGREHVARFGPTPGFLTKLLDSAVRLPVQAHPDRAAARRWFQSDYGKTETWIILGGRVIDGEEPCLYAGFNETFDPEVFRGEALEGVMTRTLSMMHRIPATPGEALLIQGGLPHAIGAGVFLLEVMEPTDWVVQPERFCGEHPLTPADRWGGVEPEAALDVFHANPMSLKQLRERLVLRPTVYADGPEATVVRLVDRDTVGYFGALDVRLSGMWRRPEELACFMAGAVLEGEVRLCDGDDAATLHAGDTFALAATGKPALEGRARLLFALPPV